jgi:hypothetical protein
MSAIFVKYGRDGASSGSIRIVPGREHAGSVVFSTNYIGTPAK